MSDSNGAHCWPPRRRGGLDLSFGGGDGVIDVPIGYDAALSDGAVAPDGKIVVCGYTRPVALDGGVNRDYFLARLNPDGSLDPTFGAAGTGVVVRNIEVPFSRSDEASSLALIPDGKIVVGGTAGVVVYNADGTPYDPTGASAAPGVVPVFVPGGFADAKLDWVSDVAAAPAGEAFYAAGRWYESEWVTHRTQEGVVDRVDAATAIDSTTVQGVRVRERQNDHVAAMLVLPDGGVIVGGNANIFPIAPRPAVGTWLLKVQAGGFVDFSFSNGRASPAGYFGTLLPTRGRGGGAVALAAQPDGKIIAAGTAIRTAAKARNALGHPWPTAGSAAVWVARLNPDGTEDRTFGRKGSTYLRVGRIGVGTSVRVLPDGRILVGALSASSVQDGFENVYSHAVARLNPDGRPDKTFGGGRGFGGRGRMPRGVLALPFAPPVDRRGDDVSLGLHSPESALLVTDAAGNVSALSASNSTLHLARLAPAQPPAVRAAASRADGAASAAPNAAAPRGSEGAAVLRKTEDAAASQLLADRPR